MGDQKTTMQSIDTAMRAFCRHVSLHDLAHYTGILSLHALARLAVITGDSENVEEARAHLLPFVCDKRRFACNFSNYLCGGNGTAYLLWKGLLPEAAEAVRCHAEQMLSDAPRDADGIFCLPGDKKRQAIFIDVAFAVTPFLLFAGLAFEEDRCFEEAFQQTRKMVEVFRDPGCGLLHQSRGFRGAGRLSDDHWSRGNGWGLLALAELANYLPNDDPRRPEAERLFVDLLNACLAVQDEDGLWHQELTDPTSYVETSGSGLILYALGVAIEKSLLPEEEARDRFRRGLRGYLDYIAPDGSVFHTCPGCLCPGDGSILQYKARSPVLNDPHAFGPVTLAFGQAHNLGIEEVEKA